LENQFSKEGVWQNKYYVSLILLLVLPITFSVSEVPEWRKQVIQYFNPRMKEVPLDYQFQRGDIVAAPTDSFGGIYLHYAVYDGEQVLDFAVPSMTRQPVASFVRENTLFVDPDGPLPETCVQWALDQYQNLTYYPQFCILNNNCETFVNFCKTGERYSNNGQRTKMVILTGLLAIWSMVIFYFRSWKSVIWGLPIIIFLMMTVQCVHVTSWLMLQFMRYIMRRNV